MDIQRNLKRYLPCSLKYEAYNIIVKFTIRAYRQPAQQPHSQGFGYVTAQRISATFGIQPEISG